MISDGTDFQFLVLGSSHAYQGIDPAEMQVSGFNASNVSQDIHFDRYLLEKYIAYMPNVKDLFLTVSYQSLLKKLDDGPESWRVKNYVIYMDATHEPFTLKEHFELLNRPLLENIEQAYHSLRGASNKACTASGAGWRVGLSEKDIVEDGEIAAKRHTLGQQHLDQILNDFHAMVTFAQDRGIRVHLITTPVSLAYRSHLDPVQLELVKSTCSAYATRFPQVDYSDLMDDGRFVLEDFYDADHLSRSGQIKLSQILADLFLAPHVDAEK